MNELYEILTNVSLQISLCIAMCYYVFCSVINIYHYIKGNEFTFSIMSETDLQFLKSLFNPFFPKHHGLIIYTSIILIVVISILIMVLPLLPLLILYWPIKPLCLKLKKMREYNLQKKKTFEELKS